MTSIEHVNHNAIDSGIALSLRKCIPNDNPVLNLRTQAPKIISDIDMKSYTDRWSDPTNRSVFRGNRFAVEAKGIIFL